MYMCIHMCTYTHTHSQIHIRLHLHAYTYIQISVKGWRRLIGSPKLRIIFHKRAIKYRSLLRKMTYKDKESYESSPPCMTRVLWKSRRHTYTYTYVYTYTCIYTHTCKYKYANTYMYTHMHLRTCTHI